jgi:hypothetical protein
MGGIGRRMERRVMSEVERNRLMKALRAARKVRAGRRSAVVWEGNRQAGRLLKLLKRLLNVL